MTFFIRFSCVHRGLVSLGLASSSQANGHYLIIGQGEEAIPEIENFKT